MTGRYDEHIIDALDIESADSFAFNGERNMPPDDIHEIAPAPSGSGAGRPPLPNGADSAEGGEEFDISRYAYRPPAGGAVKRVQLTIPEGRPKDAFFRVDPREHMQLPVSILEYNPAGQLSKDVYILTPDVAEQLGQRAKHAVIRVCICRPHILRVWAVKVPDTDLGRTPNGYIQSVWDCLPILEQRWGRLDVNESRTGYDLIEAVHQWPDPDWSPKPIDSLVRKAFKGRFVDSMDADVIKSLRGEI
jgi:hypothetical protein